MKDIYIQSKLAMVKTLHAYGVDVPSISIATGLPVRKIKFELRNAVKIKIIKRKI